MKTDKLTGPTNDAVAGLPGAEKAGLFSWRSLKWEDGPYKDWPEAEKIKEFDRMDKLPGERMVFKMYVEGKVACQCSKPSPIFRQNTATFCANCDGKFECPVPPVNAAESGSSTGQESPTPVHAGFLILSKRMDEQAKHLQDLQNSIRFLAEQVKTLIDGLAEDADPDEPPTTYMSGRPI